MKKLRGLLLVLLAAALLFGGGWQGKGGGTHGIALADMKGAQKLVDEDPAIQAYQVFTVYIFDRMANKNVPYNYLLPLDIPKPDPVTWRSTGRRFGEKLAGMQWQSPDRELLTFLMQVPGYKAICLTYSELDESLKVKKLRHWLYDKEGKPHPISKADLKAYLQKLTKELQT